MSATAVPRSGRAPTRCVLLVVLLVLAGCGTPSPSATRPADTRPVPPGFPVTVQNCGRPVTLDRPPQRVVTLWQATTEMVLALGQQQRLVAMGGGFAPLPPDLAAAARGIPTIGSEMSWPSREVMLSQQADLVVPQLIEGFAFDTAQGYASVEELEAGGAQVYSANACTLADLESMSLDTVDRSLRDLGALLDARDRAESVVTELHRRRDAVTTAVRGRPVVRTAFYNGGEGPLQILQGGNVTDLIRSAGGENVFPATTMTASREEFAASDASVVLVGTYPGQDFATLRDYLTRTFPELPAVRAGRLVEVPVVETDVSVRIVDGLDRIAAALHPGTGLRAPGS